MTHYDMIYSVIWKLKASRPIPSAKTSRSRGAETPLGTQGLSYIYIYREREREREIDIITMVIMMIIISLSLYIYIYLFIYLFMCIYMYVCMYIYIYMYMYCSPAGHYGSGVARTQHGSISEWGVIRLKTLIELKLINSSCSSLSSD